MRKTLVGLLLACILATALISAVGEQTSVTGKNFILAGYAGDDAQQDFSKNLFFQRMQERTGISFEFRQFTDFAAWTAEKSRLFAGDELPDALFGAMLSPEETLAYYQSGKIIDLKPLLKENAPNLSALLEQNPDWRRTITLPGGAIAALPAINTLRTQNAMWINKVWLERLKLDIPTDAASLQAVLEAFKTGDPNYNSRADEVPFTYLGSWDLKFLAHAFGLYANDYNMYADVDGKAQFMPVQDRYKEFVAWLKNLYDLKLLDQDGFMTADAIRKVTDEKAVAVYGAFFGPSPATFLPGAMSEDYMLLPPMQFEGKQIYRSFLDSASRGTFAITSACKDPAVLLQWVDYLYTEEGGKLAVLGQENAEFAFNENGTWRWLYSAEELSNAITAATLRSSDIYPMQSPVDFQLKFEDEKTVHLLQSMKDLSNIASLPFPSFTLTKDQQNTVAPLQMQIGRYVDESLARFVIGETPLNDETWQNYLDTLNRLGLAEFISIWQQVLDGQQ